MLDLNHPQTQHIFTASGLLDRIKDASQMMTLAATPERQQLLMKCRRFVEYLHRLNDEHFEASDFIYESLLQMEAALQELAGDENSAIAQSDGATCSRCGSELMHINNKYLKRSLCSPCLDGVQVAEAKLDSVKGFCTVFI